MHPLLRINGEGTFNQPDDNTSRASINTDPTASEHFPNDMSELLTMDADTVVELLKHYDVVPATTREDVRQWLDRPLCH